MKSILVFAAAVCFASSSFAAIEFSEDMSPVDLPADAVITADEVADAGAAADSSSPSTGSFALPLSSNSSAVAVTSAQASGAPGTTGSSAGGIRGGAVLGGGGGGQNNNDDGADSDDLVAAAESAGTTGVEAETGDAPPEPVAMPEPSTAVVWSILAALGIVAVRRRMS